jgi:endonuclease/exonuclease/phosphatase family metal-dependent hydrolase
MKALSIALLGIVFAACSAPAAMPLAPAETAVAAAPTPAPSDTLSRPPPAPSPTAARSPDTEFLLRPSGESIRVMSYNVNWDSIFPENDPKNHELRGFDRGQAFGRILRAVQPDVICLQEINYLRGEQELGQFIGQADGSSTDHPWQVANVRDTVIATRFGLLEDGYKLVTSLYPLDLQQAAALIDLPEATHGSTDLFVICAHFKAGGGRSDILLRSRQADVVMANLRDLKTPGGRLDLESETPFVILGDFNIYTTDPAVHAGTLERGDIYDESAYGEDLQPDWDETPLTDAHPSHNGMGVDFYTWRSQSPVFPWGALDRIFYTDSVLELGNTFILNTMLLSDEALDLLGLQAGDVLLDLPSDYYDHLPLVVDFELPSGG